MASYVMLYLFAGLDLCTGSLLFLALAVVLLYEAINGFHDTANVVTTIIYTGAIQSQLAAVIIAAVFNFLGVLLGGLSVAYAIIHMLPIDLLLHVSSIHGLTIVFSMLLAAIIWNFSTWYFGLPASSSHTLIGAIIGVGLTHALMTGSSAIDALNISEVINIFISLIFSPVVALVVSGGLIFILRHCWGGKIKKSSRIYLTPYEYEKKNGKKKPPFWTRIILISSAIGIAFSHGANDGQKGIGLVMLVLISVVPAGFAVNMNASNHEITRTRDAASSVIFYFQQHPDLLKKVNIKQSPHLSFSQSIGMSPNTSVICYCYPANAINTLQDAKNILLNIKSYDGLSIKQRSQIRCIMLCVSNIINKIIKFSIVSHEDKYLLEKLKRDMLNTIEYAPIWIIITVALMLAVGTMMGWHRVAVTISEKIGKKSMTYAHSILAQMTAAVSIGLASYTGIPVSTTHILSSSVAGTMIVDGSGLQRKTITNILVAWILTLPASILLAGCLYWIALKLVLKL